MLTRSCLLHSKQLLAEISFVGKSERVCLCITGDTAKSLINDTASLYIIWYRKGWTFQFPSPSCHNQPDFVCFYDQLLLLLASAFFSFLTAVFDTEWLMKFFAVKSSPPFFAIFFMNWLITFTQTGCCAIHTSRAGLFVGNAWLAFLLKIWLKQVDSCGNVLYERISESLSHWLLLFACSELDQRAWFGVLGCKPFVQTISLLRQDRINFNCITILPTCTLYLVHVLTPNRKWTQLCKYLPQKKYKVFTC